MKLAFIGLGAIGKPMSQRLIDNGYDLNLYQRNKLNNDAKRKYFFDPIEAVSDCDGLLICVTDDNAVESVLFGDNGVSGSLKPNSFVIDSYVTESCFKRASQSVAHVSIPQKMMFTDVATYLPDNILTKVDRASMSVSLEARVPLLDHRIAEFAWKLPFSYKYKEGQSKFILRQILYKYVPKEIIDRPKKGFSVPIEEWLVGPLFEWADEIIKGQDLVDQGYLDVKLIRTMWSEHVSGERRWHAQIWRILIFQMWLKKQED